MLGRRLRPRGVGVVVGGGSFPRWRRCRRPSLAGASGRIGNRLGKLVPAEHHEHFRRRDVHVRHPARDKRPPGSVKLTLAKGLWLRPRSPATLGSAPSTKRGVLCASSRSTSEKGPLAPDFALPLAKHFAAQRRGVTYRQSLTQSSDRGVDLPAPVCAALCGTHCAAAELGPRRFVAVSRGGVRWLARIPPRNRHKPP